MCRVCVCQVCVCQVSVCLSGLVLLAVLSPASYLSPPASCVNRLDRRVNDVMYFCHLWLLSQGPDRGSNTASCRFRWFMETQTRLLRDQEINFMNTVLRCGIPPLCYCMLGHLAFQTSCFHANRNSFIVSRAHAVGGDGNTPRI